MITFEETIGNYRIVIESPVYEGDYWCYEIYNTGEYKIHYGGDKKLEVVYDTARTLIRKFYNADQEHLGEAEYLKFNGLREIANKGGL